MRGARVAVVVALALATAACGVRPDVLGVRSGEECAVVARPLSTGAHWTDPEHFIDVEVHDEQVSRLSRL